MPRRLAPTVATLLALAALAGSAHAQDGDRYAVGDIVQNFTLVNRANGQPVSLHDFEGKVVFLEWFAYWCPFCQAAAAQIETEIVDYYASGNAHGVPVMHVGLNLQPDAENLTQAFIDEYGMDLVLNDFDRAVASRFQPANQPIFAIINGVENTPSHAQWELVFTALGYGSLEAPVDTFRAAIDAVRPAAEREPPALLASPASQRLATGQTLELAAAFDGASLAYQWYRDGEAIPDANQTTLIIPNLATEHAGSYQLVASNDAGETASQAAEVQVLPSVADYLANAELHDDQAGLAADPDHDGVSNLFEYLAQTDPSNPASRPRLAFAFEPAENVPSLSLRFPLHPDALGYELHVEFSRSPDFRDLQSRRSIASLPEGSAPVTAPLDASALFARIVAAER